MVIEIENANAMRLVLTVFAILYPTLIYFLILELRKNPYRDWDGRKRTRIVAFSIISFVGGVFWTNQTVRFHTLEIIEDSVSLNSIWTKKKVSGAAIFGC